MTKKKHPGHKDENKIQTVAFLGGASWEPDSIVYKDAFETARLLAESGYEVVNGGGPGVMRASTLGAQAGGNESVLAVTYYPRHRHKNYEGVDEENTFDEEVTALDYFDRTKIMLVNSDVHVVFKGGTGTISELGMSWAISRIHEGHHKPIILFGEFWHHIIREFKTHMVMRKGEIELLSFCNTPQEVLDHINSLKKIS